MAHTYHLVRGPGAGRHLAHYHSGCVGSRLSSENADGPPPLAGPARDAQYRNRYWNFVKNARFVRCSVSTDGNR